MSCGNYEEDQRQDVCNIHDICCHDRLEETQELCLLKEALSLVGVKTGNDRDIVIDENFVKEHELTL